MKEYKQFDMDFFEDACLGWPADRRNPNVHSWFDEPVQWPNNRKYLPNAGATSAWGETFPKPAKPEEYTGGEQIRHVLNFMGRLRWTPNTFPLVTTFGDEVNLKVDWYQETSANGKKYYRPIEIINGRQYTGDKRPWYMSNVWPGKLSGEQRSKAGLRDDPSYADLAAAGMTG